ncbi:helix-turn-helix transcriptional regulator [Streptococcus infantis]|jgi:hypothetical protein|uniref:helix-turn-helix domain-containing protein n=1 Tax=Streptococcus infantis TaxID=68892 RepID=UPI002052A14D|nr:MAG TPA: SOS-response transcriptional repressor [Caudoviricetes sp.]DAM62568.1 MAG TPA: SOS-response transcriptional repressor [Caudoviricetes sp.]DAO40573.1 MAG TPA: SOS-response transcriptional repressor [Caudoviricetes sp.]DAO70083.1 MAG TPA: SOS-response transcriptional repressor [Caudoviricetes sp.]DAO80191.1 MAG TPA: SOS-response transcriptional repressor [Caudoviricetes sp.]
MLNIDIARKEKGISIVDIADYLSVRSQTVSDKLKGKYPFTFQEAMLVQEKFFPEYELKYLFTSAESTA